MRKILLILLILTPFIASSNYAQGKLEHLKFMGIPIDGKIKQFRKNLEKKGLRYYVALNNYYVFEGFFAGDETRIYALFDENTQIVYSVGVIITCMSQKNAKEKFDIYVRNFKDKYEIDKWEGIMKYYSENNDSLIKHIANGTFKSFNRLFTDSINHEFNIFVSEIVLDDNEKKIAKSPFNIILGMKQFTNLGNIGTIKLTYGNDEIMIAYRDEQNYSLIEERRKDDL